MPGRCAAARRRSTLPRHPSDIARGFIRCEVIRWDDLLACGSHAEAARRGLQRLEGKTYVVAGRRRAQYPGNFGV